MRKGRRRNERTRWGQSGGEIRIKVYEVCVLACVIAHCVYVSAYQELISSDI